MASIKRQKKETNYWWGVCARTEAKGINMRISERKQKKNKKESKLKK